MVTVYLVMWVWWNVNFRHNSDWLSLLLIMRWVLWCIEQWLSPVAQLMGRLNHYCWRDVMSLNLFATLPLAYLALTPSAVFALSSWCSLVGLLFLLTPFKLSIIMESCVVHESCPYCVHLINWLSKNVLEELNGLGRIWRKDALREYHFSDWWNSGEKVGKER